MSKHDRRGKTIVDIAEFQRRVARGHKPGVAVRFATDGQAQVADDSRIASFVFSDGSVDRYGDTINPRGWALENFNASPVALFGHDYNSVDNVIGRALNVRVEGDKLIGDIEFMESSVNKNAETVFQMVKAGFLKTVSVGFQPLEWAAAKDKSRAGGIDFRKQELLEISIVPVPANPHALIQAKAAGFDVEALGIERVLASPSKKGLYEVSWLAELLASLGYLSDCVEWEADYEGDGSAVPEALAGALGALGKVLVDMTAEEVAELLASDEDEEPIIVSDDPVEMAGLSSAQKALVRFAALGRRARQRKPAAIVEKVEDIIESRAGKVLSSANEKTLRDAHEAITKGCDMVRSVFDQAADDNEMDDQTASADDERETRERKARALKRRASLTAV